LKNIYHADLKLKKYIQNSVKVYDSVMKYVFLAIFVLIAAQPVQAKVCDMNDAQNSGHSQHGSMHDTSDTGMDCCEGDASGMDENCSMEQCGTYAAGMTAIKPSLLNLVFNTGSQQFISAVDAPMHSSSSPPFRPPIS
jgi:hypothetical protein